MNSIIAKDTVGPGSGSAFQPDSRGLKNIGPGRGARMLTPGLYCIDYTFLAKELLIILRLSGCAWAYQRILSVFER